MKLIGTGGAGSAGFGGGRLDGGDNVAVIAAGAAGAVDGAGRTPIVVDADAEVAPAGADGAVRATWASLGADDPCATTAITPATITAAAIHRMRRGFTASSRSPRGR